MSPDIFWIQIFELTPVFNLDYVLFGCFGIQDYSD